MENNSHLNNSEFQKIAKSNLNKVSSAISKIGYSDGITEGRESVFQKGFDFGYKDGFKIAFEITKYKAFAAQITSKTKNSINSELANEVQKFGTHTLNKFDKICFAFESDRNLPLDVVSATHNESADKKLEKLRCDFPNLSNLLG